MELVRIENNQNHGLVVSSRVVAEQLERRHDQILRDLDKILETTDVRSLVIPSTYNVEGQKREYKEYLLTKDGFTLYMFNIQGHNNFKLAYINKFNEMESQIQSQVPQTYAAALLEAGRLALENEQLESKIKEDAHRVSFAETIEKASDCILIRDMSKILSNEGIKCGERKLYKWLRERGLIMKTTTKPTQKAMDLGLFNVEERLIKTVAGDRLSFTTKVTGKGQLYILQKFKQS